MPAYRVTSGSAHIYLNSIIQAFSATVFLQGTSSGIANPTHKAISQTVLSCGSLMVEQAIKCYQSRGIPLYL